MTIDGDSIVQGLMGLAMAGLVADHFRLRGDVSRLIPREEMKRFEDKIDGHFSELRGELQRLGEGVAELRGRSGG